MFRRDEMGGGKLPRLRPQGGTVSGESKTQGLFSEAKPTYANANTYSADDLPDSL